MLPILPPRKIGEKKTIVVALFRFMEKSLCFRNMPGSFFLTNQDPANIFGHDTFSFSEFLVCVGFCGISALQILEDFQNPVFLDS